MGSVSRIEELHQPLLHEVGSSCLSNNGEVGENEDDNEPRSLKHKVWIESKKLWHVAGPSIFSRVTSYSMNIATQAFAGHLGDLELASISIANTVIVGFNFGLLRFLQSQLKTAALAWVSLVALVVHVFISWLFIYHFQLGIVGTAITLDVSWWILVFGLFAYVVWGGCIETWNGFSMQALSGLWDFLKLSAASGIMLCVENWYYRILILMTGNLANGTIAIGALSVCMGIMDGK